MGLFGKKEACPICGGEVKGLFSTKIGGGKTICKECDKCIVMQKELLKKADVDFVKEHLEYRKQEAELFASMEHTYEFDFNNKLYIVGDEGKQLVSIDYVDWYSDHNPVILQYDQLKSYALYRQNKKLDDDKTPGYTYSHTATSALGKVMGTSASDNDFFDLKLTTGHKYWPEMEITLSANVHFEMKGFTNNMSSIGNYLKSIVRGEPFETFEK